MSKTKLCQAEMETPLVSVTPALVGKNSTGMLLDFESSEKIISKIVSSRISHASPDLIPLEERPAIIKDVTQNTWVKLLFIANSSKIEVTSPSGYIASAARSESIDEIRRRKRKRTLPLPLDQDGELSQGKVLLTIPQGMRDPAIEYELKEFIAEIIDEVVQLPPKQMCAMICVLKDEIGHTFPLTEIFREHRIDITLITWPRGPKELQRFRSLVSVARRTLREKFNRPIGYTRSQ